MSIKIEQYEGYYNEILIKKLEENIIQQETQHYN